MKNICLITPHVFPVPAVKGGACEQLVTDFINMNEIYGKLNITVVSIFDDIAYQESKKYHNTKFEYIKVEKVEDTKQKDLHFNTLDKNFDIYIKEIKKQVDLDSFDYVIIEGGDMESYGELLKYYDKNKMIAHLHGNFIGTEKLEEIYKYFICVSNHVSNNLSLNSIIPKKRVFTIYNGIDTEKFNKKISTEEKQQLKEKYEIDENDIVVLFCGRTVERKGVKELLLAIEKIKNIDKCKVLIVGNSNFANEVKTEYDQKLLEISKRIPNKIKFTGFINNDELYKIHNIADISVIPTINEEPFGLVVVEAMSSGLPIIATISGGIPEIVDENSAILLKKDENLVENLSKSLDYLIENENIRINLGEYGKTQCTRFSLKNYYNSFIEFFNNIV